MSIERIETPRLILRRFRLSEVDDFFYYNSKAALCHYMSFKPHESREESERIIKNLMSPEHWALEHREDGIVMGVISLKKSTRLAPHCAELGYTMSDEYWGEGLMQEAARALFTAAFDETDLVQIDIKVNPENQRSVKTMRALGFHEEGLVRRAIINQEGQGVDALFGSLTKAEWQAQRARDKS